MSVRLIRENSDTPNITNRDDARMIRYAYGGQNGFVKGRGAELSHNVNGNVFTINSGVINLQGWEVEIDSNGWSTTLSASDAARKYCAVYCEVNLSLGGSAKIDLMTSTEGYPGVPAGDDLTANSNGTARVVLYRFIAQSGNISDVNKIVSEISYIKTELEIINDRLNKLGFKEGVIDHSTDINVDYSLKRQGNYVIGYATISGGALSSFILPKNVVLATLSEYFHPKQKMELNVLGAGFAPIGTTPYYRTQVEINTSGEILITDVVNNGSVQVIFLYFGFEAEPIN